MVSATDLPRRYHRLLNNLEQRNWKGSDGETRRLMLEILGKNEEGYWEPEDYNNFPCKDLEIINNLWNIYSQGRFGFSVQKCIYESMGPIPRGVSSSFAESFGDRLGWRTNNDWLYYRDLKFSITAPRGHLPWLGVAKNSKYYQRELWDKFLWQAIRVVDNFMGLEERGELLLSGGIFWIMFYEKTLRRCNFLENP